MNRKVLFMILDGWGEGRHDYSNAIWTQGSPNIDYLREKYPSEKRTSVPMFADLIAGLREKSRSAGTGVRRSARR